MVEGDGEEPAASVAPQPSAHDTAARPDGRIMPPVIESFRVGLGALRSVADRDRPLGRIGSWSDLSPRHAGPPQILMHLGVLVVLLGGGVTGHGDFPDFGGMAGAR